MEQETPNIGEYIDGLQAQLDQERSEKSQYAHAAAVSGMFSGGQDPNLIEWQLELKEMLDELYHLLSGHQIKQNDKGDEYWAEPDDDRLKPFNDYGVKLLMNIMKFYLNRNTLLANYTEEEVYWKVYDFGLEVTNLIFMKYEEMGMDDPEKMKLYPMICRALIDTVHSAYTRAIGGGERDSLRSARMVTQSETPMNRQSDQIMIQPKRKASILKPWTWARS